VFSLARPQWLGDGAWAEKDSGRWARLRDLAEVMAAKPDDVLALVTLDEVDAAWPLVERYLGKSRPFWAWLRQWWQERRGQR
jgi:hypothetical protein